MTKITAVPLINNRFVITIDEMPSTSFSSMSEISDETEIQEKREISKPFSITKIPGATSTGSIVFTRGFTAKSSGLDKWREEVRNLVLYSTKLKKPIKRTIIIQILSVVGEIKKQIILKGAWPTKYVISGLDSLEPAIMLETLEVEYTSKEIKSF